MTEAKSNRSLLMPLVAGLLGAGLALFFAPRSGRETREKMRMQADEMKDKAEDSLSSVRRSLNQSIEEAQDLKKRLSEALVSSGKKPKQEMDELGEDRPRPAPTQSTVLSTWEEEV